MSEQRRTKADSSWTQGWFAVPPAASAGPDAEWRKGYRYWAHLTRHDGAPVVDGIFLIGPEINAAALRALKGLNSDVAISRDRPEGAWRAHRPIDDAYEAFLEACLHFETTAAAGSSIESEPPSRPRLVRPNGTDPRGFSRRVAEAYTEAVRRKDRAPAKALAAEAGVPVTTVHRWIRDARRAGFLGPAIKRGAAG